MASYPYPFDDTHWVWSIYGDGDGLPVLCPTASLAAPARQPGATPHVMLPLAGSAVLTAHELKPRAGGIFEGQFSFVVRREEVARVIHVPRQLEQMEGGHGRRGRRQMLIMRAGAGGGGSAAQVVGRG